VAAGVAVGVGAAVGVGVAVGIGVALGFAVTVAVAAGVGLDFDVAVGDADGETELTVVDGAAPCPLHAQSTAAATTAGKNTRG
jgi:hypothetical protein